MIKTQPSNQTAELTKAQAKALTERIRQAIDKTYELVLDAYERKAWKVMGYKTWEAYVQTEFDMSRRHSYRLLDQGRVIRAIEGAAGENVTHGAQIPERATRELKDDPDVAAQEITAKVEQGADLKKAVSDVAADRKAEKEKAREARKEQQARNEASRQETASKLPPDVQAQEEAKAARKGKPADDDDDRLTPEDDDRDALLAEMEELREANAALEKDVASLKAENKKYAEMKAQWEKGGFEKVIADKDREIDALKSRVYRESEDKASWKSKSDYHRKQSDEWKKKALKLGAEDPDIIRLDDAEAAYG